VAEHVGVTRRPTHLARLATTHIRDLIADGVLLQGERIYQREIAAQIGISLSPLREALRVLEAEGLLSYSANLGYEVARFNRGDLVEIYQMRAIVESEALQTIEVPSLHTVRRLHRYNSAMMAAIESGSVGDVIRANRGFHFTIIDLSPDRYVKREVFRLWRLSESIRSLWWQSRTGKLRIGDEHVRMIDSVQRRNVPELLTLWGEHRTAGSDMADRALEDRAIGAGAGRSGPAANPVSGRA
jgi:DNA-binding GntR family transcriptional regulator